MPKSHKTKLINRLKGAREQLMVEEKRACIYVAKKKKSCQCLQKEMSHCNVKLKQCNVDFKKSTKNININRTKFLNMKLS